MAGSVHADLVDGRGGGVCFVIACRAFHCVWCTSWFRWLQQQGMGCLVAGRWAWLATAGRC